MRIPGAILVAFALAAATTATAAAELGAGDWQPTANSRIRLVPGPAGADGARRLGIHIELAEGWHTYWRNPGASGVPPRFDWSASANVADAEVRWPAPKRLRDEYGVSYGYETEVVFPVTVRPETAGEAVRVRLALDFAVCAEICIPEFAELDLAMPAGGSPRAVFVRLLDAFEARVPLRQAAAGALRISPPTVETVGEAPALAFDVTFVGGAEGAELFVEGPEQFYFVAPDGPEMAGPSKGRFVVRVPGADGVKDLAGARIGATLVTDAGAVEAWWTLDQ
jgi:DsbC/DsbD-like thiol-disulfide interchange protein